MNQSIDAMTVRSAIKGRCSVRAYAPDQVDEATLRDLLSMAVRAPTARHSEPWEFLIIQDANILKRLSDRTKEILREDADHLHPDLGMFGRPDFNVFYDAGTLIVICANINGNFAAADCWLAAENLMLAAYAMGLGTCVIGSATTALNEPDVKRDLGMTVNETAVAPIIVGVPSGGTSPTARRESKILAWHKATSVVPK